MAMIGPDKFRGLRLISESLPNGRDMGFQCIQMLAAAPDAGIESCIRHRPLGTLGQHGENPRSLGLQSDGLAISPYLVAREIHLAGVEGDMVPRMHGLSSQIGVHSAVMHLRN